MMPPNSSKGYPRDDFAGHGPQKGPV